ncbi:hypothetical protein ACFQNF_20010 [Iodobacter arcticus]|uniref:Uncharacterized protein n=1 Tax=Iodobacter arcticus TaxID=590593 RepID=A0ABW2R2L3_9NEIS
MDITKEKNKDIGFVIQCLFTSAISVDELKQWAAYVMEILPDNERPDYILDLLDFDQPIMNVFNVLGFVPSWECSDEEDLALYGIAIERGRPVYDVPGTIADAKEALLALPNVRMLYEKNFPFIN